MPRQARRKSDTGIYHVVLRGINKQTIFEDTEDAERFLSALRDYKIICGYKIYAYCLMSNHVHLLIEEGKESLDHVFKRIAGKYVYWYNNKYRRVGHLFQDRFTSEPVETDEYLLTVLRYIHQNPIKAGISESIEYARSSYLEYTGDVGNGIADVDDMPNMMSREAFVEFHAELGGDDCIDIVDRRYYPTDEEAAELVRSITGMRSAADVQKLNSEEKRSIICKLREQGLSVRQLSRITGISKTFIESAKGGNRGLRIKT